MSLSLSPLHFPTIVFVDVLWVLSNAKPSPSKGVPVSRGLVYEWRDIGARELEHWRRCCLRFTAPLWAKWQSSWSTGRSLFLPSPMGISFRSWPKGQDGVSKWLNWVFLGFRDMDDWASHPERLGVERTQLGWWGGKGATRTPPVFLAHKSKEKAIEHTED